MNEDAKRWLYWGIPLVVVIGLGAALWYGRQHRPAPEPAAQSEPAPVANEPEIKHPIEPESAAQPLPALENSDPAVRESLGGVFGRSLEPYLVPQNILRRFVVTVDNLPRKKTAVQMWPLHPAPGNLVTESDDGGATLSPQNYARYTPLVKVVQNAGTPQLVAMYRRFYPLLQETYVGLGYPQGYFNDRVVEVIDDLLAAPDITGPIKLTQPSVFYQFADPSLEERSAGQKVMIRMGSQNAAAVKAKLRELRREIAKQDLGQQPQ